MEEISDELFIQEMRILWQDSNERGILGKIIRNYFETYRAQRIINKLQEGIE